MCLFLCASVCTLLHVVTYVRVFTLRDASVTGAELIVTDGCRQAQTYILLWYTEEEEEERCMVIKAGGPSCTPLLYSPPVFISPPLWQSAFPELCVLCFPHPLLEYLDIIVFVLTLDRHLDLLSTK